MSAETKTPRNALAFKQRVDLANYLSEHKEALQRKRPTYEAVAEDAALALGFTISRGNVYGMAKELDILWSAKSQTLAGRAEAELLVLVAKTLLETLDDIRRLTTTPELADKMRSRMEPLREAIKGDAPVNGEAVSRLGPTGENPLEGRTSNGA